MSRNKENIPVASTQRLNNALSSSKQLPSDEFFTDSLLDVTRVSSQIPTPSPQKPSLTKARRARNNRNTRNVQHPSHRPSASESLISRPRNRDQDPSTPLKKGHHKSSTRVRTHSLTTPPELREALSLPSPYSSISSPPPQDLTDAYRQIADEEVLAQTERELSSDESSPSEIGEIQPIKLNHRSHSDSPLKAASSLAHSSRASTPTRTIKDRNREYRLHDRTEALSEASGLSFLKELTDQGLAAKLTPHVSESARDRAKMREVWSQQKPIAFSKANIPLPGQVDHRSASSIPVPRTVAFSKAARPSVNGNLNIDRYSDPGDRPLSRESGSKFRPVDLDPKRQESPANKPLPTNSRLERHFFSRNHGFPPPRAALTEQNLAQQNRSIPIPSASLRSQSSAPSLRSDRSSNYAKPFTKNSLPSRLPQLRKSPQDETKAPVVDSSQVNWAEAAADVPLPSVESSISSEKDLTPLSLTKIISPDKSRRWDNDFTGQSFQVSESPPVRQKPLNQEYHREREIQGIAKKAVATSRLSEIRERESRENLRSTSQSPAPRSASHSQPPEQRRVLAPSKEDSLSEVGEQLVNPPVVIYRSTSNSLSDKRSPSLSSERPPMDRSKSHDHLQRLAKAMGSTPRSSPGPEIVSNGSEEQSGLQSKNSEPPQEQRGKLEIAPTEDEPNDVTKEMPEKAPVDIAQTPRVTGAWTDTILPDTIRTVKQTNKQIAPAQTPHVSAGGWIDTPAPSVEQRKFSGAIPTIAEVPEELTSGIVKDNSSSDTIKVEPSTEAGPAAVLPAPVAVADQPRSALASILEQQKFRLASKESIPAPRDDTLNLGQETIDSLQGLIQEDDMTTLSRISQLDDDDTKPVGDADLLERLGVKLDRIRSSLHVASKGISRLEYQVSQPVEQGTITSPQQLLSDTICSICNQQTYQPHSHHTSKYFPRSSFSISLPIPLLFRPREPDQRIPRPTPIGWATIVIWLWYIVENVMCELYCRPAYTDFYVWPTEKEPEFPLVLPTMLARWLRLENFAATIFIAIFWMWNLVKGLARALWRILSMWVGWSDGFAADNVSNGASTVTKKIMDTATSIVGDAVAATIAAAGGGDMTTNDDEYI